MVASCGAADSDTAPGFPTLRDASNTGYTGVLTAYGGASNTLTTPGLYEDLIFNGRVNIKARDITIRNCFVDVPALGGSYGIVNVDFINGGPFPGLVVEDTEIRGGQSSSILASSGDFIRCNMHTSGADAVKVQGGQIGERVLIQDCYIHDLGRLTYNTITTAHADGIQIRRNSGGDLHFIGTNFDLYPTFGDPLYVDPNACSIIQTADGPIPGNILFNECYFGGGNYVLYFTDPNGTMDYVADWNITNNIWRANEWVTGPLTFDGPIGNISGNRRLDNGDYVDDLLDGTNNVW